ncbi:MAG: sulfite exporter TauE/SafE family protein [Deltaproteobacteria bacterium]|nr:sulfite exporter TauE/SafE family protein [Deltaproteobacteria bacterium]
MLIILLLLLLGVGSGLFAGLLGLGGGLIFLPLTKFYYIDYLGYPPEFLRILIATSSAIIVTNGLSATVHHYRKRNIDTSLLPYFIVASILGSRLGVLMVDRLPVDIVRYSLCAFMLLSATRILLNRNVREEDRQLAPKERLQIGGIGFGISALLSMLGLGGGALMTPVLNAVYSQPIKKAIGTATMFTFTVAGTACFYYLLETEVPSPTNHMMVGYVDIQIALPVAIGGLFGSWIGANMLSRSRVQTIRYVFAVLLIAGAAKMAF